MIVEYRFSLRQLLLVISVLCVCVAAGRWCYVNCFDRVHSLAPDDPFGRANLLDFHVGNRVALRGRYEHIGADSQFTGSDSLRNVLWFGGQPIAIVGVSTHVLRTLDDTSILVKGRLVCASPTCSISCARGGPDGARWWTAADVSSGCSSVLHQCRGSATDSRIEGGRAWPCGPATGACGTAGNRADARCATSFPRFPAVGSASRRRLNHRPACRTVTGREPEKVSGTVSMSGLGKDGRTKRMNESGG